MCEFHGSDTPHTGDPGLSEPSGTLRVLSARDPRVLRLAGEVDLGTVLTFEDAASRIRGDAAAQHGPFVADVGAVTFIDAAGLAFIFRQSRAADGSRCRPVLLRAPAPVRRLLRLTGLHAAFDYDS